MDVKKRKYMERQNPDNLKERAIEALTKAGKTMQCLNIEECIKSIK